MNIPKKILIVEDEISIAEVMTIILEEKGYKVTHAKNEEEVQKNLKKQLPDLIFLDIWVQESRGDRLAELLKANKKTSDIPIILISANSDIKQVASRSKVDDFLAKPFSIEELVSVVEKHL